MRNNLKTAVLLAGLGGAVHVHRLPSGDPAAWSSACCIGLAMCGGSYWFSDKLAIALGPGGRGDRRADAAVPRDHARPVPRGRTCRCPACTSRRNAQPNAFATGRSPDHAAVCVTEGLLDTLTWDEIQGVLAHEISHVRNRDILIGSVAAAIAMGITFVAQHGRFGAMFGGGRRRRPRRQPASARCS